VRPLLMAGTISRKHKHKGMDAMSSSILIRLGGLAPIVGGVVYVLSDVVPGEVSSVLFLLSVMAVIVALHLLQREHYGRERSGWRGTLGFPTALAGLAFTLGGIVPFYIRVGFPIPAFFLVMVGMLVATIGILALGGLTLDAGVLPWWCGAALIAGNPLFGIALLLVGGPHYDVSWLIAVPWVVVGFAVFRAAGRRTERPPRVR
jgi:hypothetical protein